MIIRVLEIRELLNQLVRLVLDYSVCVDEFIVDVGQVGVEAGVPRADSKEKCSPSKKRLVVVREMRWHVTEKIGKKTSFPTRPFDKWRQLLFARIYGEYRLFRCLKHRSDYPAIPR